MVRKAISIHVYGTEVSRIGTSARRFYDLPVGARALGSLELGWQSEAGEDLGRDERSDLLDKRALEREDVDRQR
jgi:hypothetical protein